MNLSLLVRLSIVTSTTVGSFFAPACLAESRPGVKIIEPKQTNKPKNSATIDTERYQVGVFTGFLSVEDFSTNSVQGLSAYYRINDTYMVGLEYGSTEVGLTTAEERELGPFVPGGREWTYQAIKGAYKLFSARSFLSPKLKYDSDVYFTAGVGKVEFANNKETGFSLGASYRVVVTDWLVVNMDLTDHIAKTTSVFEGPNASTNSTHNVSFSLGLNALF